MAQVDTLLGWSAKNDWLLFSQTTIASISGYRWNISGYENQTLPVLDIASPSASDIITNGMIVAENVSNERPRDPWTRSIYAVSDQPGVIIGYCASGTGCRLIAYGPSGCTVTLCVVSSSSLGLGPTEYNVTPMAWASGQYMYYQSSGIYHYETTGTWYVPAFTYDTLPNLYTESYAYVNTVNVTFSKDNQGYAVACIAEWYTPSGTRITSPILISSVPSFVDMSCSSSAYNYAKASFLYDGRRFYMGFWDCVDMSFSTVMQIANMTQFGAATLEKVFNLLRNESFANILLTEAPPDPYEEEGGESSEEGGDGEETEDDENGIETNSDYPSAINTGFCRIYTPSETELRDLSNYLWSSSYDLNQVKKLFSNPMDSVLGLSAVPIRLSGPSVNFSLGGVQVPNMTLPMVSQQRYTYFMGGITVKERWGSYLDYDPYTRFSIFLPFIGMRELSTDDIMGKQVMLYYDIDILSGTCTARLQAGKHCLYEWGGSCALQLPINSRNWDSVFNTAVGAVSGIVSAVTSGAAPLVAGSAASAALQTASMKPRIDKSGNVSGASGWLGQMRPYLIRTTPEAYIPGNQNQYIGYPSYTSVSLGSLTGYNEVDSIHLENIPATGDELAELESILKGGVIY